MKIVIALFTTAVSALIIFYLGFATMMGGTFEEIERGNLVGLLFIIPIPFLVFGTALSWVNVFKPFSSLSMTIRFVIFMITVIISSLIILTIGQVGIFARF